MAVDKLCLWFYFRTKLVRSKMIKQNNASHGLEIECMRCKTRFEVWLSDMISESDLDISEESIRNHFYHHCPACEKVAKLKTIIRK